MYSDIKKLIDGNKQFRATYFNQQSTLYNELVERGQKPKVMIISCCDSRVDPAVIFNCKPGDLFVIRNVANLVPPCENNDTYHGTSAALEFGVCFLEVAHIIVFGHTQCGGIQALVQHAQTVLDKKPHSFIAKWMELARPAYAKVMSEHANVPFEEKVILCEQYALINSLLNLQSFPWIQERVTAKKLAVHAWYFDLATGMINVHEAQKNEWRELV
jgi:carbonic anhydrase